MEAARLQQQLAGLGGDAEVRRLPMSLGSLVQDNVRAIETALGRRYTLDTVSREAGSGMVEGDPHALGIVLVELAEWVATYHGGAAGSMRIEIEEREDSIRLLVTDDGQGLSATQRAALPDPTGPGLGLASAFGVIEQHDGRTLVDSVIGRGTTFHIEFPTGTKDEEAAAARRGTETILVVEDEEPIRRWVQVTLEALGYTVLTARNGGDAAALLRERRHELDLLIIDAVLPGISGLELIAETLTVNPKKKVLLMTGYSADRVGSEVLQQVPLLEKPFTPAELVDWVNQLLDAS
ncbi:MAG: response regulator [Proteobacteria bacterium]|nr:response regulator [Pseudomonadota bacterium]